MALYICPHCGSQFFLRSKSGLKIVFHVESGRTIHIVQPSAESLKTEEIDRDNICCGACSWHGSIDKLVESHRD